MRSIEWIGQTSIFEDPVVEYNLARNAYTPQELRIIRLAAARRKRRVDRRVIRELRPDSPTGLSKFYRFGPSKGSYVQRMTDNDARIVLSHPRLKQEFVDVTDDIARGPARHNLTLPDRRLVEVTNVEELGSLKELVEKS